MRSRLLLVEDDASLALGLADNFRAEGYDVRHAETGEKALALLRDFEPQIGVLDIMLPGCSGLDVLRQIRREGHALPVLLLTAKGEVVDKVVGLELGADDYLAKPFALEELLARVRAMLRRAGDMARPPARAALRELVLADVHFDFRAFTATGPEGPLDLSPHDLRTLRALAERRGEVVSRADLVEEVSGMDSEATLRTVDNHIVALRRVLGDSPRHPRWIHTVRGEGYRLASD